MNKARPAVPVITATAGLATVDWPQPDALPPLPFDDLPQREKKFARTRLGVLDALVARLDEDPFEAIVVRDLARDVGVSEGTVFNHFNHKGELLTYFNVVWGLEVGLLTRQLVKDETCVLPAITALFADTAKRVVAHPTAMLELIAHQARMPIHSTLPEITPAERLLRFGRVPGILTQPASGLEVVLPRLVVRATETGELPPHADVTQLTLALASTLLGVPLLLGRRQPEAVGACYSAQLALIWAGAREVPQEMSDTYPVPKSPEQYTG